MAPSTYSSQRNFGASILDWCYTARSLILKEAGLDVTLQHGDFLGEDIWQRSVIAALNVDFFNQWKAWIKQRN